MNSVVNPMELKDLESVARLSAELGYTCPLEEFRSRFLEISALPHHKLMVVRTSEVQGWIHLEIVTDLIEPKKVEIKALIVTEENRGEGSGKKLLEEAKTWVKSQGLDTIYLSCNIKRDRAHAFYLREGFIKQKTSHFFELTL